MQFLNPIWLLALPLVLLPIVIHLLNQRRHRTVAWGAMQFLLSAKRMNRGMARLRRWMIMAMRMLVIAGLIFTITRPLSSGWVGALTGGKPETVIVLLDRSASMQRQQVSTGETRLSGGVERIVSTLQTLVGNEKPLVLIESTTNQATTVDRPAALLDLPAIEPTDAQSDMSAMLQSALDYISDNQAGRTDIWICSDVAANDWNPDSSRWKPLNSSFAQLEGVRFHVLKLATLPEENMSVVVSRVEHDTNGDKSELVLDVTIERIGSDLTTVDVPVTFTINGLRSVMNVELEGTSKTLVGHRIPVAEDLKSGWGKVELPADASTSDDVWYFAFAQPSSRNTVVVTESKSNTRAALLAAATSTVSGFEFDATQIASDEVNTIDWQSTALLIWQAPLPTENVKQQIENFVDSGRTVIFLPPEAPNENSFAGISWQSWEHSKAGQLIGFWNNDTDLLARTRSGAALPVSDLVIYRHCSMQNQNSDLSRVLAKLDNEQPLLLRHRPESGAGAGAIYFLATWPASTHSSFGREGITMYSMLHRAIASAAESMGAARQFNAGSLPARVTATMPRLAPESKDATDKSISANLAQDRPFYAGVYGSENQLVALNRPLAEDKSVPLGKLQLGALFGGLDHYIIEDQVGSGRSLTSEIWRFFIALMGIALLAEALLCLPPKSTPRSRLEPSVGSKNTSADKSVGGGAGNRTDGVDARTQKTATDNSGSTAA